MEGFLSLMLVPQHYNQRHFVFSESTDDLPESCITALPKQQNKMTLVKCNLAHVETHSHLNAIQHVGH